MFHLKPKPRPPESVGRVTPSQLVDSSAMVIAPGHALVDGGVHLLEELHGLEVLAAAVHVGLPLAGLAAVVEVDHRRHGIHAQAVDVVLLEPVQRVGDQEVADLAATEVEDEGAPVGVLAARGVRVLVERRAVEARQREGVLREVRRHPVDDHADARLVQLVDEVAEAVGVAEPRRGREVGRDLVAPRAAVRVLHDRQELHVGEAEVDEVGDQVVGDLLVGVGVAAPVLLPRAEVHLVDRHRPVHRRAVAAVGHPLVVAPRVGRLEDHRRRRRGSLGVEGHRVGLLAPLAVGAEDQELVLRPRTHVGHEQLPDPRGAELAHRVLSAVPAVEVALDPHAPGGRRPDGEGRADDGCGAEALVAVLVSAEDRPQLLVPALVDQVEVHLAEARQEPVGVVAGDRAVAVVDLDAVVRDVGHRQGAGPDAGVLVVELDALRAVGSRRRRP